MEVQCTSRLLIPLDGSNLAERVLPYARFLVRTLKIPAVLLEPAIDREPLEQMVKAEKGPDIESLLTAKTESSKKYQDSS